MLDGMFVFDNVIHVYDMSEDNLRLDRHDTQLGNEHLHALGEGARWSGYKEAGLNFRRRWTPEEMYDLVFVQAPTDMAMAQVVPVFDWYKEYWSPVKAQYEMALLYPERVLFCGGVDPVHRGVQDALDQLDHQIGELGACSIKFYNGHVDTPWRCDDEQLAYPLYQRCRDLGVNVLQFHKGLPFGTMELEPLSPLDLQRPARDFPDLTFIVHHLAMPYFDEAIWLASRFPNVHLALSGNLNYFLIAPRLVQKQLGRLLLEVGVDKLLWGSESGLAGGPGPYLQAFLELEIPEDLRRGYGYPQLTRSDREKILGLNFAKIMGIDVAAKQRQLAAVGV